MLSDKEIVEGCKKGKKKYQDMLYKKYAALLLGVSVRYTKNRMEAEDILHDSFIKIFINIKKFEYKHEGSLFSWAKRITVNTSLNYLRDNLKHAFQKDIDDCEIADENDDYNTLPDIEPEKILTAMQDMPNGYKVVFNMFFIEKYSHNEISEQLGISLSTSKSQLFKARKYLREKLNVYLLETKEMYE